jgi:hypothetical protein
MKSYESITVASLPVVGDKQNYVYPNPTKPSLELLVVDEAVRQKKPLLWFVLSVSVKSDS